MMSEIINWLRMGEKIGIHSVGGGTAEDIGLGDFYGKE
jgi:hypothetical protein